MFTTNMTAEGARKAIDDLREELAHVGAFMTDDDVRDRLQLHICALMDDCEEKLRRLEGAKYDFVVSAHDAGRLYEEGEPFFVEIGKFKTREEAEKLIEGRKSWGSWKGAHAVYAIQKKRRVR